MGRQFNALVADEEEQVLEVVVVVAYQDVEHQPAKQRYPREGFVAAVRKRPSASSDALECFITLGMFSSWQPSSTWRRSTLALCSLWACSISASAYRRSKR
nr:hypothetical protein [Comamonas sp.]